MRLKPPSSLSRAEAALLRTTSKTHSATPATTFFTPARSLAQVRDTIPEQGFPPDVSFRRTRPPQQSYESDLGQRPQAPPPDPRTVKLGKTLRTLQERLPTLLASPLPQEILSPSISLHLFPSTHPHLPTATGRVAYHAALWTSPITWGRVPLVGNVKLDILSERMIRNGPGSRSHHHEPASTFGSHDGPMRNYKRDGSEKLVVRWRTCGKTRGLGMGAFYRGISAHQKVDKITHWLGGAGRDDEEFTGLFLFEFDEEGRIATHTIEHVQEGGGWDGNKMITLTDWLLGRFKGQKEIENLALGYVQNEQHRRDGIGR